MKINVERLIGAVQESFDSERDYRLECKKKDWWKRTTDEQMNVLRYERDHYNKSNEVSDLCTILGMDWRKLNTIARLARKWEQKRKWQLCFPAQDHEKKIMEYLTAEDKSFTSEINYIYYKINKTIEKKAA